MPMKRPTWAWRSWGGARSPMIASDTATMPEAKKPVTARKQQSSPNEPASEHAPVPKARPSTMSFNRRVFPKRSPAKPHTGCMTPYGTR